MKENIDQSMLRLAGSIGSVPSFSFTIVQGDHSAWPKPPVDIDLKVAF